MLHVSAADAAPPILQVLLLPLLPLLLYPLLLLSLQLLLPFLPPSAPLMLLLPLPLLLQLPMQLDVTACVVNSFATLICSRDKRYISTIYLLLFSMLAAMPLSLQPCRCCGMNAAVCCRAAAAAVASSSPLSALVRQQEQSYSAARADPCVVGSRVSIGREMKHLPADRSIRGAPIEITIELE